MDQKLIEEIKEKLENLSKTMTGVSRGEINSQLKEIAGCAKDELVVFEPQVDDKEAYEKSSPKIMIVGRETFGWDGEKNISSVKEIAKKRAKSRFWLTIKHFLALNEHNGDENKVQEMSEDKNELCSSIVWSNLYKLVSSEEKEIPESSLYNAQISICAKLLKLEFKEYAPSQVIFLSNWGWARHFIKEWKKSEGNIIDSIEWQELTDNLEDPNAIGAKGLITLSENQIKFVASKYHPGAMEGGISSESIAKNIIKAFE